MKTKYLHILLCIVSISTNLNAQSRLQYELEAQSIVTSNNVVPFWMRSNQFGSVPSTGLSSSFLGRTKREYDSNKVGKLDWGIGFEGRVNAGKSSNIAIIEGYVKARLGVFQLQVGRTKEVMGFNGDTSLSSGNFAISGNALGIPKIEISVPIYSRLPIVGDFLQFKGNLSHGWAGKHPVTKMVGVNYTSLVDEAKTYLHQKSLYMRFGKNQWPLKIYGGFNHQVYWGDEKSVYGDRFGLSSLETLFYVATGKAYGDRNNEIPRSKVGNQLGSIDLGAEYTFKTLKLTVYRQNFYDVGALSKLANIRDGLNGVTLENLSTTSTNGLKWKKLLFEFLYTKHQAGEFGSKPTKSGDEDYYNNSFYPEGWSYQNKGLGSPLLTTKISARKGLPSFPADFFINNRVIALHAAGEGQIGSNWSFNAKASYSVNYGTFGTSPEGHSTGPIIAPPPIYGLFGEVHQFSGMVETNKSLSKGWSVGLITSIDQGKLLDNSIGILVKTTKKF